LESALAKDTFKKIHVEAWEKFDAAKAAKIKYTAVLLCHSKESAFIEIGNLRNSIPLLSIPDYVFESPSGSYCSLRKSDEAAAFGAFGSDIYPEGVAKEIEEQLGLPLPVAKCASLGEIAAAYMPKHFLLRLGAKLLSRGIPFDMDKFFDRFDFYVLNQPSFIRKVPTGLPGLLDRFGSPENRERIDSKGVPAIPKSEIVWDFDQLIEMTSGSMAKVLGDQYAALDTYERRARLPMPPYLFLTRVTGIDASFGKFEPSSIDFEYDIKGDCVLRMTKNIISRVLLTEAAHAAILIVAYLGVDVIFKGDVGYRVIESKSAFHSEEIPVVGDTFKATLKLTEFTKVGSVMLIHLDFVCYLGDELILHIEQTGGFFSYKFLDSQKAVNPPEAPYKNFGDLQIPAFRYRANQKAFVDLEKFFDGEFGPNLYPSKDSTLAERLYIPSNARLLDRIISIEQSGGKHGLGYVSAEMDLDVDHWAFDIHFINDPVLPGTLLAEAANQIMAYFAIHAGYFDDGKFWIYCVNGLAVKTSFLGPVRRVKSTLQYKWHIKSLRESENKVTIISDFDVFCQGGYVCNMDDISLIIERDNT
ncbi:MAG: hypothetical protein LBH09_04100, partial [Peptococcaceae bacterium]|nr:hypothetical protein [Peptococcaceae bacterium]